MSISYASVPANRMHRPSKGATEYLSSGAHVELDEALAWAAVMVKAAGAASQ